MNKKQFIVAFASINVLFIFAQIYKHTQVVKCTYAQQQYEKQIHEQTQTIQELTQQLCALKNRDDVQAFAQKKLGMQSIALKDIKRVPAS